MKKDDSDDTKHDMGHEYDGIREDNHPAPRWWWVTFILSIIFGAGYYVHYEVQEGESLRHKLDRELMDIAIVKSQMPKEGPSETDLLALVKVPAAIASGKEIYMGKCFSCHGNEGQGLIGPNLTDQYWINGNGSMVDIHKSIDKGIGEKGMPPWGAILKADELNNVTAFVKSLQGSKPPNPKAPQGNEVKGR